MLQREILRSEVVPDDWRPALQPQDVDAVRRPAEVERDCQPFGHWSIWQRTASADPAAGPELFSFFFLAGEISAIYQGLYTRLAIAPKVLAIIQPGTMGGEWENSCSDQSFFKQVVRSHAAGLPEYLLHGGTGWGRGHPNHDPYPEPCWREYRGPRLCQLPERYAGVWARRRGRSRLGESFAASK